MLIVAFLLIIGNCLREYGVYNTLWFIFHLDSDEFSDKPDLNIYYDRDRNTSFYVKELYEDRILAHNMDAYLNGK